MTIPQHLSKDERYMAFLLQEWPKLAEKSLRDPAEDPISQTRVLDASVKDIENTDGMRLEFGVWQGKSITRCATNYPQHHWFGFDSFEGFPDDGRVDWQKPFKVIELPDTPSNVTLVKGYFSDTLDPFLKETPGKVAFVNVDCDIYSSTVDIFNGLKSHDRLYPGLTIYFDELINYADYMWNESLALFELLEETGMGVEWMHSDHRVRQPKETIQHFYDETHPTWMDDMRSGHWMQATCILTDTGIDYGPVDDPDYVEQLKWMVAGYKKQETIRQQRLDERNERLKEMELERERRYVERKKLEKQRQQENLAKRKAEEKRRQQENLAQRKAELAQEKETEQGGEEGQ